MNDDLFPKIVGYSVMGLWIVGNVVSFAHPEVTINHYIHVAAMAVVGYCFGLKQLARKDREDDQK